MYQEFGTPVGADFLGNVSLDSNGIPVLEGKKLKSYKVLNSAFGTINYYSVGSNAIVAKIFKGGVPKTYVNRSFMTVVRGACFKSGVLMEAMEQSCDNLFKEESTPRKVRDAFAAFMEQVLIELPKNNLIMTDMKLANVGAKNVGGVHVFKLLDVESITPPTVLSTSTYALGFSGVEKYTPDDRKELFKFACSMTVLHAYRYKMKGFYWTTFAKDFPTSITEKQQFMKKNIPNMKNAINRLFIERGLLKWKNMAMDALNNALETIVDTTSISSGNPKQPYTQLMLHDTVAPSKKRRVSKLP